MQGCFAINDTENVLPINDDKIPHQIHFLHITATNVISPHTLFKSGNKLILLEKRVSRLRMYKMRVLKYFVVK